MGQRVIATQEMRLRLTLPTRDGRVVAIYDDPELFEHDDYAPGVMDDMKRAWQSRDYFYAELRDGERVTDQIGSMAGYGGAREAAEAAARDHFLVELVAQPAAKAKGRARGRGRQAPAQRDDEITDVIFRIYSKGEGGEVIALFPDIDEGRGQISSYMHNGQHGAADYMGVMQRTKPAKPQQYAALKRELEGAPYNYRLRVRQRR